MFEKKFLQELKTLSKDANILIVTHRNPDADAHCSALAMKLALKEMGYTNVYVHIPKTFEKFKFLSEFEQINDGLPQDFKLVIILDTPKRSRLGTDIDITDFKKIVIDHHDTEENEFGDIKYVVPEAAATCEILFYMFKKMKVKITKDIAMCLYTGILSDTDLLRSRIKSKKTLKALTKMFEKVNHQEILVLLTRVSENEFLQKKNLYENVRFFKDKDCVVSYIDKSLLSEEELNGKIDVKLLSRNLQEIDCEIKVLLIPTIDGLRVSVRSNSKDIIGIVNYFGGGGHKTSAGAALYEKEQVYFSKDGNRICNAKIEDVIELVESII